MFSVLVHHAIQEEYYFLVPATFSFAFEDFTLVYMAQSCCNPFDIPGHSWNSRKKNLRPVTEWMCERASQISIGSKICDNYRKKLSKEPAVHTPEPDSPKPDSPSSETEESKVYVHTPEAVASLNMCLADIGETPYSQVKGRGKTYSRQKFKRSLKQ